MFKYPAGKGHGKSQEEYEDKAATDYNFVKEQFRKVRTPVGQDTTYDMHTPTDKEQTEQQLTEFTWPYVNEWKMITTLGETWGTLYSAIINGEIIMQRKQREKAEREQGYYRQEEEAKGNTVRLSSLYV